MSESDYRTRLFDVYLTTYLGSMREVTRPALERQRATFRHYFGRYLPRNHDARILEVGCGYGGFLYFLNAEGFRNVEGIDVSPEQVDAARGLGIEGVTCSDAGTFLRGGGAAYDCIVGIDFLEHFPKEEALELLDLLFESLRPGGTLILQTPNAVGPLAGRHRYIDFTHAFALTPTSARQILEATGFRGVEIRGTDPFVHGPASLLRVIVWRAFRALLRVYFVAETGITEPQVFTQNLIAVARRPA